MNKKRLFRRLFLASGLSLTMAVGAQSLWADCQIGGTAQILSGFPVQNQMRKAACGPPFLLRAAAVPQGHTILAREIIPNISNKIKKTKVFTFF